VIGRGFSYALLRAVTAIEDAPLQAALERLAEADILLVQGLPPDSDYRFKHALIQDAAYENLLKSRRQSLHCRIAETLRDQVVGPAAPVEPELLAHHFTEAGLTEAAIEWSGKAGQQSLERSALIEAAVQFTRALDQIATQIKIISFALSTSPCAFPQHMPRHHEAEKSRREATADCDSQNC
jgi:predicted ATPase